MLLRKISVYMMYYHSGEEEYKEVRGCSTYGGLQQHVTRVSLGWVGGGWIVDHMQPPLITPQGETFQTFAPNLRWQGWTGGSGRRKRVGLWWLGRATLLRLLLLLCADAARGMNVMDFQFRPPFAWKSVITPLPRDAISCTD